MKFTCNKTLTDKLKNIEEIGTDLENGLIMGIKENDELIPLSKEIYELVVLSIWGGARLVEVEDLRFKITVEQLTDFKGAI